MHALFVWRYYMYAVIVCTVSGTAYFCMVSCDTVHRSRCMLELALLQEIALRKYVNAPSPKICRSDLNYRVSDLQIYITGEIIWMA